MRRQEPDWLPKTRAIARSIRLIRRKSHLSDRERSDLEAVGGALVWLERFPDGSAKAAAMRGAYYEGKTLCDAAESAGYTLSGIKRTHRQFLTKVAENLGYI